MAPMVTMGIRLLFRFVMSTSRANFVGLLPMPLIMDNGASSATWRKLDESESDHKTRAASEFLTTGGDKIQVSAQDADTTNRWDGRTGDAPGAGPQSTTWYRVTEVSRQSPILRQYGNH